MTNCLAMRLHWEDSEMLGRLVRGQTVRSLMLAFSAATVAVMVYVPTREHQGAENAGLAGAQESCPAGYTYEDPLEVAGKLNPAYAKAHEADIRKQFGARFCFAKDFA